MEEPTEHVGIDRKDALTKRPLDFDQEEEVRKEETSKWLENHFGSDSRSSHDDSSSVDDLIEPTKRTQNSYFNVTIKSKQSPETPPSPIVPKSYIATLNTSTSTKQSAIQSPDPKFYQGVTEWSERKPRQTPSPYFRNETIQRKVISRYNSADELERIESPKYRRGEETPTPPERSKRHLEKTKHKNSEDSRYDSGYRSQSRNDITSSYVSRDSKEDLLPFEEPPPDYSPPPRLTPSSSPSPPGIKDKKLYQRTRFAAEPTKSPTKSPTTPRRGNIIGQGIRKLVGKIRSASAERKAKQKAKSQRRKNSTEESRSPSPHFYNRNRNSPTYQQFNVIDNYDMEDKQVSSGAPTYHHQQQPTRSTSVSNLSKLSKHQDSTHESTNIDNNMHSIHSKQRVITTTRSNGSPVQRYYLGEDPFGGSIYGRENKYDGVRPVKSSSRKYQNREYSSPSAKNYHEEYSRYHRESPVPIVYEDDVAR